MSGEADYRNRAAPTETRVSDLLERMTLREKVGQMFQGNAREDEAERWVRDWCCGSLLAVTGQRTVALQRIASEETRLGIPLILGIDAIHGHNQWREGTVFPTQLALGCSWNPELGRRMAEITAREMTYTGVHWTFSPGGELVRDIRWGRCDEAFAEDPLLAGEFVKAMVEGYQGRDLADPHSVLACPKHFAGYCETQGGRDASEADLSRRKMLSAFLPAFEPAVRAGAGSIMSGYNAIDGEPCNTNRWLLTEVLIDDWGFDGITITDWNNVEALVTQQFTCRDLVEASIRSIEAGMHMCMATPAFVEAAMQAVESGRLDISLVDEAVRRILTAKFRLGLFDDKRYADIAAGESVWFCAAHQAAALAAAQDSLVLLKNEGALLPLAGDTRRVALFGANADDDLAQLGDWSRVGGNSIKPLEGDTLTGHPRENIVTILDGLSARADIDVAYVRGCGPLDAPDDTADFDAVVCACREADVAVVVAGDRREIVGERCDRSNPVLSGNQQALLEHVVATGTPVVLLLVNSKPLDISWAAANVPAIVEAFNPGILGGTAVARALFGEANFNGKLSVSFPRSVGQQPAYYNQLPGWHALDEAAPAYVDEEPGALFPFGYGLSYTTFEMADVRLCAEELRAGETLTISAAVTNTGNAAGAEVVQVYVNDLVSSLTTPLKELKGFAKVELAPGESAEVHIDIPHDQLSFVGPDLTRVVEPGEFEVMVGNSSRDEDLVSLRFSVLP